MTSNICARDKTPPLPRGQTTSAFHQNKSQQIETAERRQGLTLCTHFDLWERKYDRNVYGDALSMQLIYV